MKKNEVVLFGKIDAGGKLAFNDSAAFAMARARFRGRDVQIAISPKRELRSDRQNRYYWGVVLPLLSNWCGFTPDEMHDSLRVKFLRSTNEKFDLEEISSTTSLTTAEFENYMTKIREWASSYAGVFIPEPNEEIY